MGYFSNGTAGDIYEAKYCSRCAHENDEAGCAVMLAHLIHNYDECNKPDSILHLLIPLDDEGWNKRCTMFIPRESVVSDEAVAKLDAATKPGSS